MPLMKYLESRSQGGRAARRRRRKRDITLSKTRALVSALDSEHLSEMTEEEMEQSFNHGRARPQGFLYFDYKFLRPFFIRKFTQQELKDGKSHVTELTDKWYQDIQASPLLSSESDEIDLQIDQD